MMVKSAARVLVKCRVVVVVTALYADSRSCRYQELKKVNTTKQTRKYRNAAREGLSHNRTKLA